MINGFKMGDISCMATLVGNTMLNHEDTMGNLVVRCRCLAFLGHLRMGQLCFASIKIIQKRHFIVQCGEGKHQWFG